ncbi:peptidase M48 [Neosynechococcus sphagnicola sy1]|uniref:Peptidase M48 n=1 Tax=Neosynechococcus sphagnicola sy1 TaxID=1497020 RepID=A0A098TLT8_9CYAN|nr:zinc metalloprotease HtpX [Neosynechococcus sphagnicola]KGF73274.1 peptidase M48 [Neosynechococcus sphagnicola sy1]
MSSPELLQAGLQALQQQRYAEAIEHLERCCQSFPHPQSSDYVPAHIALVQAYQRSGQVERAIAQCQALSDSPNLQLQTWVQQALRSLKTMRQPLPSTPVSPQRRRAAAGVKLVMAQFAGNLALASGVTISLLVGMVLVLCLGLLLIVDSQQPLMGFAIALGIVIPFNLGLFLLSPLLMDLTQHWLYGTRWVTLAEIESQSPAAAAVLRQVCAQRRLQQPRLGIIEDQNPTAFTYGSFPNQARLVVSQGLFTYLDADEVATVYAHELGHIVHWDFAVMTLAATMVQITYLIYVLAREFSDAGDSKIKGGLQTGAIAAYLFYWVGTYLVLYLSRTREYYADHFAAETTGNPNGLSRALVKIAYGILEEGQRADKPSKLIEGTRTLGIYDPRAAVMTGTAYRLTSDMEKMGRVFLWDMFNPWGWWMELQSTHPLTGKRIRALSNYAEQLGLVVEFDLARVVREGRSLSKQKLYRNFGLDLVIYMGDLLGLGVGLLLGGLAVASGAASWLVLISLALIGFGLGTLIKTVIMFPDFQRAPTTDILTLMSDPYASPLRGQPVKLEGELIGRGDAGYVFGSDLKLQDATGMIFLRYSSRFGGLGNFLFGATQVKAMIGSQVGMTGWFRRGLAPWIDLIHLQQSQGKMVESYHRFWLVVLGAGALILGFILPLMG